MKVVIITEGGGKMGLGHVTRCEALREAFDASRAETELIIEMEAEAPVPPGSRTLRWSADRRALMAAVIGAEIAVIDSYRAGLELYEAVANAARLGVYLDDTQRMDYPPGVVLNGGIGAARSLYPSGGGVTYLLGPRYAPMRKEFRNVATRAAADSIGTVLLTFGGGDDNGLTARVSRLLAEERPGTARKVVAGPGVRDLNEVERTLAPKDELIARPAAKGMLKAMLSADLAVTSGGQTLYELAAAGVPAVAVEAASNQRANIAGWVEAGFARSAGAAADRGPLARDIIEGIASFDPRAEREKAAAAGRNLVDGCGAQRAVDAIMALYAEKAGHGKGA